MRVSATPLRRGWGSVARTCLRTALALAVSLPAGEAGTVGGYSLRVRDVGGYPGLRVTVPVEGAHEESAQGFSVALRYPAKDLSIERVHVEGTILEAIGTDFFEVFIEPDEGFFTVGCLVDALPPFTGNVIPDIDRPLHFFSIEALVSVDAEPDILIEFADGAGEPPVRNLFVVRDRPQPMTELVPGLVLLPLPPRPAFLRGDVDLNARTGISDSIRVLDWLFRGGRVPWCRDAADVNDDGSLDLSDPVYLLVFLYTGGPAPPPPSAAPGLDPTDDGLDCIVPLFDLNRRRH